MSESDYLTKQVQAIRAVLDDVCGACVASDTRVHSALAALDALVAECDRLRGKLDEALAGERLAASEYHSLGAKYDRLHTEIKQLHKDITTHLEAISGEDGTLSEHGLCSVCSLMYED